MNNIYQGIKVFLLFSLLTQFAACGAGSGTKETSGDQESGDQSFRCGYSLNRDEISIINEGRMRIKSGDNLKSLIDHAKNCLKDESK